MPVKDTRLQDNDVVQELWIMFSANIPSHSFLKNYADTPWIFLTIDVRNLVTEESINKNRTSIVKRLK